MQQLKITDPVIPLTTLSNVAYFASLLSFSYQRGADGRESRDEKLNLVTGNLHRYIMEMFHTGMGHNDPFVLDLIREMPGFEIVSNEKSIVNAWNKLISVYSKCGDA